MEKKLFDCRSVRLFRPKIRGYDRRNEQQCRSLKPLMKNGFGGYWLHFISDIDVVADAEFS